jgi:hypothetical protein
MSEAEPGFRSLRHEPGSGLARQPGSVRVALRNTGPGERWIGHPAYENGDGDDPLPPPLRLESQELARSDSARSHVVLLWSRRHRAAVVVDNDAIGELVELDVRDRENRSTSTTTRTPT